MSDAPTNRTRRSRHIYEIDVVRVLTFGCVIAVHTTAHTNPASSVSANAALMILHFTREAFFFLTGFVLVHQYIRREVRLGSFYWRRIKTVGIPYVVWSAIYSYLPQHWHLPDPSPLSVLNKIAEGTATYHLYFLLVSLQIYLLYPLIAKLLKATAGHHVLLLGVSGVLQAAWFTYVTYYPTTHGWLATTIAHDDALIVSYQFYVLVGGVVAFQAERIRDFVGSHKLGLALLVAPAAALALVVYFVRVAHGTVADLPAAVLQPVMIPWALAAVLGLWVLGAVWSARRVAGSALDRALKYGSDRSFGIFLVHPAIIGYALDLGWVRGLPALSQTLVTYLMAVAGSLMVVEIFRRSPLSVILTGREQLKRATSATRARPVTPDSAVQVEQLHRKDTEDANDRTRSAGASEQASLGRNHDGDGWRPADPVLQ